jgi:outer membrane receptor protein involved in Fe transport
VSYLRARAAAQELLAPDASGTEVSNAFTGNSRVWIADAVWKWAPNGNATRTNFKLQGEYLRSTRAGSLVVDPAGLASEAPYRAVQSGWYLQGVYQFMPRWRVGLRTERLSPGSPDLGANEGLLGLDSGRARKTSLMLEHNPSEFSRVRLQLAQDRARAGMSDLQWLIQYQMSLGAHGAHGY